jgi:prolipoprotein diacylglyceryltransferase
VEIYLALSLAGNSGYQGLASHGAAISIIVAMYYFSKIYYKTLLWILDRVVIAVASGAIFL